jgi:hypothetical protein
LQYCRPVEVRECQSRIDRDRRVVMRQRGIAAARLLQGDTDDVAHCGISRTQANRAFKSSFGLFAQAQAQQRPASVAVQFRNGWVLADEGIQKRQCVGPLLRVAMRHGRIEHFRALLLCDHFSFSVSDPIGRATRGFQAKACAPCCVRKANMQ